MHLGGEKRSEKYKFLLNHFILKRYPIDLEVNILFISHSGNVNGTNNILCSIINYT